MMYVTGGYSYLFKQREVEQTNIYTLLQENLDLFYVLD
jgi:hypothetical protein